jgi:tetratricopeptide (TPR) repeat protein
MAQTSKNLETRIEALHEQFEAEPTSGAFFPFASLLWQKGEIERAITVLNDGLLCHPSYLAPRVLLAKIYLTQDRMEEAAGELEKVVEKTPWNLDAQKLLLETFQKRGDGAGVRRAQVSIGMFDPTDEIAVGLLEERICPGAREVILAPEPETVEDEAPLDEAIEPVPTPSLAELYISQGHLEKAAEVYRQLLDTEPENQAHSEKLAALERQISAMPEAVIEPPPVELEKKADSPLEPPEEEIDVPISEEVLSPIRPEEILEIQEEIPAISDEPLTSIQPDISSPSSVTSPSGEFVDEIEELFSKEEDQPLARDEVSEDLLEGILEEGEPEIGHVEDEVEPEQGEEI